MSTLRSILFAVLALAGTMAGAYIITLSAPIGLYQAAIYTGTIIIMTNQMRQDYERNFENSTY